MNSNNHRIIQFDALRVIAIFAVVLLHTSAQRFYDCFPSFEWEVRNVYDSLVRWSAPMFIMISGALFLNPEKKIGIKDIYTKYILRIVLIFVFWSIVYAVYGMIFEKGFSGLVNRFVEGPYHFWFLKMIIGLYIFVPFLRFIVTNEKLERYVIYLSLVTVFIIPMFFPFLECFSDNTESFYKTYYYITITKNALAYAGYFVLGYYLTHTVVSVKAKRIICLFAVLSVVTVSVLTGLITDIVHLLLYNYLNLFTLFETTALFIVLKDMRINPRYHAAIIKASRLSLGIYVIHPLVMFVLNDFLGINSATLNPIYFIPVFAIIVFGISYLLVDLLSRIPYIKRLVK